MPSFNEVLLRDFLLMSIRMAFPHSLKVFFHKLLVEATVKKNLHVAMVISEDFFVVFLEKKKQLK